MENSNHQESMLFRPDEVYYFLNKEHSSNCQCNICQKQKQHEKVTQKRELIDEIYDFFFLCYPSHSHYRRYYSQSPRKCHMSLGRIISDYENTRNKMRMEKQRQVEENTKWLQEEESRLTNLHFHLNSSTKNEIIDKIEKLEKI